MKLKCLSCEALARMSYYSAAFSPHVVDVELYRLGLHNDPANLGQTLQGRIDDCSTQGYDAIVLAYGLCGKATHGLTARTIPLVIPRAHDCITLFLGSRERYQDQFENKPGTYWYALDYLQRNLSKGTVLSLGAAEIATDLQSVYQEYVDKYGQDNADYLMSVMGAWQQHYKRAAYIDMGIGNGEEVEGRAREDAQQRGWTFDRMAGDNRLVKKLIDGDWDEDFLIIQPGQRLEISYDEGIVKALNTK